jgi:outer membrane lipoprotein carrier protein
MSRTTKPGAGSLTLTSVKSLLSMKRLLPGAVLLMFGVTFAHAGSIEWLKSFMEGAKTARAQFSQTVLDRNAKVTNESSGTMQFARPGKFRWEYTKPYPQLIVGDGQKLWIWDSDLNQVTVKKLGDALGSTPAALLAGNNEIEKSFTLIDAGSRDGIEWLQALPKDKESTFENIRLGFDEAGGLQIMELLDNFGQKTIIRFAKLEKNLKLGAELFKFKPPKGADVIGE